MNQAQFVEICEATAYALCIEASADEDGRYSFLIDGIDVLLDHDQGEGADTLFCYIDLGIVSPDHRALVCEQLLELNLRTHDADNGAYAFDPGSSRAIFCGRLVDTDMLDGEYIADMLRFYIEETEGTRHMIAHPELELARELEENHSMLFAAALA